MLRRVNLKILLGIVAAALLSFGISAGAAQEEEGESQEPAGGAVLEAASGDGVVEEARDEFEQLQWEVQAAHGARLNAEQKQRQIADDIADTQNELAAAEEQGVEAKRELADTASQVYREDGFGDLLDVLLGAQTFEGFTERVELAARLLVEKQEVVEESDEAEEELARELEERRVQLAEWETTGAEEAALEEQVLAAESEVQAHLDALPEEVREDLETGREQQLELDRARGEEILAELAQTEPGVVASEGDVPEEVQTATEKLAELRDIEQAAEKVVTEKALEAEQARLALEQAPLEQAPVEQALVEQPSEEQPSEEQSSEEQQPVEEAPAEDVPDGSGVEQAAVEAERAVIEAEQAATQAAEQAEAAEKARQVAEREVAVDRTAPLTVAEEAERQAADRAPEVSGDANGVVDAGDQLRVEGDYKINPGASVTFEDADGTRGTAIDGVNADIHEGSIETDMLGPLENVTGGDGIMDTTGDLGVVDTTGIGGPEVLDAGLAAPGLGPILGAAGLQYDPSLGPGPILDLDPIPGVTGLQYDPVIGATGLQYDPVIGTVQDRLNEDRPGMLMEERRNGPASGQPGLQPSSPRSPAAGGPASGSGIVAEAMSWLGTPYSFGGTSRGGISCSGLVMMVYEKFGISLPNSPGGQLGAVGPLNKGPAPAGAIVFFTEDGSGSPTHVGISNGDGTMTDANVVKGQVGITPIDVVTGYMGWGTP